MNGKKILTILGVIVVLILIATGISVLSDQQNTQTQNSLPEEALNDFTERVRNKVITELGQPIEGFEPFMFLRVYPGLEETDFDNVDALIGVYKYEDGELSYDLQGEMEAHSAARAISDEGMATLLTNISERLNVDLAEDGAINKVIESIESEERSAEEEATTITGETVCLPHKDREGPQTLECALGLLAENGDHYGLIIPDERFPTNVLHETGYRVKVTGTTLPPQPQNIYDVIGVIEVETIEEL